MTDKLLSVKEVAALLGVSVKTVKVRCARGKLAPPKERIAGELFWCPTSFGK